MRRVIVLSVLLTVTIAVGQHWEFEQVDTAGWGRHWVELEYHPDGRCFVAYGDQQQSAVRVAFRDTVWMYQDAVTPNRGYPQSFAVSRTGKWGIAYADSTMHASLLEWRDSVWVRRSSEYEDVFMHVPLAYDSAGNAMLLCNTSLGGYGVVRVTLGDTWEAVDTVLWNPSPYFDYGPVDVAVGPDDGVWALVRGGYSFPGGDPPWSSELYLMHPGQDSWERERLGGGTEVGLSAMSLAAGLGTAATSQREAGGLAPEYISRFTCNSDSLDTLAWASGLTVDGEGRLCLAYTRPGELSFMYRDSLGWHRRLIATSTDRGSRVDVEMDSMGQPVVAFSTSDGVWIARGVGVLGTSDHASGPMFSVRRPTIMCAAELARLDCRVLDITGREVTEKKEVLRPGVYFLRPQDGAESVRKVIIQR